MGCCWHGHAPWCHGYGFEYRHGYWPVWELQEPVRRRRGGEERLRDLEERQAELQEELAAIGESLRRMKQAE
jgi:hypothetical protein